MSQRALALALVAVLALPATAHAGPAAEPTGFACGLATTNDITGLVMSTTDVQTGTVVAGPVTYPDYAEDGRQLVEANVSEFWVDLNPTGSAYLPASNEGIECILQTDDDLGQGVRLASTYATVAGPVGFLSDAITFVATGNVWICTVLHWYDPEWGPTQAAVDDNPLIPGPQCEWTSRWSQGHAVSYRQEPQLIESLN